MPRGLTDSEKAKAIAFCEIFIPRKRNEGYKAVHCRFSGFNTAFRKLLPEVDVTLATKELELDHKLALIPCRGGIMIYLWEDRPASYKGPAIDRDAEFSDIMAEVDARLAAKVSEPQAETTLQATTETHHLTKRERKELRRQEREQGQTEPESEVSAES